MKNLLGRRFRTWGARTLSRFIVWWKGWDNTGFVTAVVQVAAFTLATFFGIYGVFGNWIAAALPALVVFLASPAIVYVRLENESAKKEILNSWALALFISAVVALMVAMGVFMPVSGGEFLPASVGRWSAVLATYAALYSLIVNFGSADALKVPFVKAFFAALLQCGAVVGVILGAQFGFFWPAVFAVSLYLGIYGAVPFAAVVRRWLGETVLKRPLETEALALESKLLGEFDQELGEFFDAARGEPALEGMVGWFEDFRANQLPGLVYRRTMMEAQLPRLKRYTQKLAEKGVGPDADEAALESHLKRGANEIDITLERMRIFVMQQAYEAARLKAGLLSSGDAVGKRSLEEAKELGQLLHRALEDLSRDPLEEEFRDLETKDGKRVLPKASQ